MNWNIIPAPAAEELAFGYSPDSEALSEEGVLRRFIVMLFAIFGLLAALQNLAGDHEQSGQRRIAETNLAERKVDCRHCPAPMSLRKDQ